MREALAACGIRPSKAMGQNFLIDANILRILIKHADIRPDEAVLEIGPGLGILTGELVERAKQVIAIEKDRRLCAFLRKKFPGVELIQADAVELLGSEFKAPAPFKVVANLPYSVATAILERLVEREPRPRSMVVTLQREVAERLAAVPRQKQYGALTLFTQLCYHATIVHVVSRNCFYPKPKVESAVVVLERRDPRVKLESHAPFHEVVRVGFSQRRKMLRKLLADYPTAIHAFTHAGIPSTARAEELSLEQWITLANALRAPLAKPRTQ